MNEENTFKLELTLNELNTILACLGKQPFEQVFGVVNSLQSQAQKQAAAMQAPPGVTDQ